MPRTSRAVTALGVAVACCLPLTATVTAATASATTTAGFYTPPANVPATPGVLLKSEKIFTGLSTWGDTTRIMYSSLDANNTPVAVTGAYIEPWAKWSGPGPRPLVSFAVGTIGEGDQCAPSKMLASSLNLSVLGSLGLNYESTAINNLLADGVAVVVTDYVGLGTPNRPHTYMNRLDQAHAVLDAARAASQVSGATVTANSKVATYGYSQGGGASGAAVEAAPSYAPELNVAAAYVGAPPANLTQVLSGVDASPIMGVLGYFIDGAISESPAIKSFVDTNFNAAGQAMLAKTATQCSADTVFAYGGHSSAEYTKTGQTLAQLISTDPSLASYLDDQYIGRLKPAAAVRVASGVNDDIVPHAQARQVAVDWCAQGANVTYAPLSNPSTGAKSILNHAGPLITDQLAARDWVVARLKGQAATSNCSSIANLP